MHHATAAVWSDTARAVLIGQFKKIDQKFGGESTVVNTQDGIDRYETGATRGAVAERYDLLPAAGLRRGAMAMARGAQNHGERNWMKGIPVEHCLNHAMKHIVQYLAGDGSEDHLGHAVANLMMACHFDDQAGGQ